jgi:hypothetical protein
MQKMRNKFPGHCFVCASEVQAGEGFFQSKGSLPLAERRKVIGGSKWLVRCRKCISSGNKVGDKYIIKT